MAQSTPNAQRREAGDLDEQSKELALLLGDLVVAIKRSAAAQCDVFHEAVAAGKLGPRHLAVIARLVLGGEQSVSKLASRLEVTLTTASLLVGELSRAGLVERREDERDRRRTLVRIAEEHRNEIEDWLDSRLDLLRRTLEALGPVGRTAFLAGIQALVAEFRASASHADQS